MTFAPTIVRANTPTAEFASATSAPSAGAGAAPNRASGTRPMPYRFWTRTFLAAPVAVGATLLTRFLAGTAMTIPAAFSPLQFVPIALFTATALHAAAAVLALCFRFAERPVLRYQQIAGAVLLVSVVPDFALLAKGMAGATPATVALLVLLHLVAGLVGVWVLPALAVGRGRPSVGARPTGEASPFRHGARSFGMFYPSRYVLAVYRDDATGGRAADALRAAGFARDEVVVVSGAAVVAHEAAVAARQGVLTRLRAQWARLYTDASAASRRLHDAAAHGAAFVLAYAPEDDRVTRAAGVLRPLAPDVLRHFGAFTVTDLS